MHKEIPMSFNSEPIVQQVQTDFHNLLTYVTGAEARAQTAYTVELTLFRRVLALGAALLRLFFLSRAADRPTPPHSAATGQPIPYHDRRAIHYTSVFGPIVFARHYFYAIDAAGICPLDADLSLPPTCYSDLLREWAADGFTDRTYRASSSTIEQILGLSLGSQALETIAQLDARDVAAFYDQALEPATPIPPATIVVAQADGKGIPMVQPTTESSAVRLGKGQKRTKKKEAIVTALYTIAPYVRTPQEVLSALLHERETHADAARVRPAPVCKELRASLEGKETAIRKLAERAALREGRHISERVALTDGAEPLQEQMLSQLPDYSLVLDIIHATEYLWESANAVLGETNAARTTWIRQHLEVLLEGRTDAVIAALEQAATAPGVTTTQVQVLRKTIGYYQRNRPYMRYDQYLARGWPIGTGVVEGACRHLVKDRMEQAGMRWTKAGAQAVLDLRAVRLSGDWEAYWHFHRHKQHERLYGAATPLPERVEAQALQQAA
jgi:hypothetical protein